MDNPRDTPVATLSKNERQSIVIQWRKFESGGHYLDIRTFKRAPNGELRPTIKGIAIKPGLVEQFLDYLADAEGVGLEHGFILDRKDSGKTHA